MTRFAAIIVFAGAVILFTRMLAPAEPTPAPRAMPAADFTPLDQAAPIIEQMNAQVEKLRERLAAPPTYPAPTRDPFRFGKTAEPPRPKAAAPAIAAREFVPPPPPVLPRLVAITSSVADGVTVRTAVLAAGDDLHMVKAGAAISNLVIRSIGADVVEVADPSTGASFKIFLQ